MNDVTFAILKVAIAVCASLITMYAVPYLYELQKDVRFARLIELIGVAVRAAEQTIKDGGAVKKERVMGFVKEYVTDNKMSVSDSTISDMIEAAVYQVKRDAVQK